MYMIFKIFFLKICKQTINPIRYAAKAQAPFENKKQNDL
ncbi:hypothetical protein l11_20480 [Neisseria weaveri LMG 5135]|nr:hypothetical protein l11_20480 [Neisseria weaveri LMG 5135]